MQIRALFISISLALSLTHCMTYDFSRRIIQQGNLLTQDKIKRLHVGMSKDDVAILMGTSLVTPVFNNDRWDYAYTWRKGNKTVPNQNLSLYFTHEKLTRIKYPQGASS
jgi:outer membrane protein assembly factor BamE